MSYDACEIGTATAAPVELYLWSQADDAYRYTGAQVPQTLGGETFAPAPLSRNAINQGAEINRSALAVVVPFDHPVAQLFALGPPVDVVRLTLWRRHSTDPDAEAVVIWQGRVLSCEWSGVQATLHHEPVFSAVRRAGLRRLWGYQCSHVLGADECRVDLDDYRIAGTVVSASGVSVAVAEAASRSDGYWVGGDLTGTQTGSGRILRAMIVGHVETILTLNTPLALAAGDAVVLSPGCDHSLDGGGGCVLRFANAANYGGFPWTPKDSPYGGTAVY